MCTEAWLRATKPFMFSASEKRFVPGVGPMFVPGSETRLTDGQFFWTISAVNSLGFVDRPVPPAAAAGCRVAVLGDSFVVARQVPIAEKFHVRLEALAAATLPHLHVNTVALALPATGQINQLALYDNFARSLRPRVVVLVFVANDFADNSPTLKALSEGGHPSQQPWLTAARTEDGELVPRLPDAGYAPTPHASMPAEASLFDRYVGWLPAALRNPLERSIRASWLVQRLYRPLWRSAAIERMKTVDLLDSRAHLRAWPDYPRLREAHPITQADLAGRAFAGEALAPIYEEALAFTGFALDQFKERAQRDGAELLILASHNVRLHGERVQARLAALATARGIAVIDQYDYIVRRGASPQTDAHWPTDSHWNAAGHQWAAEAMFEHLTRHEEICAGGVGT